MTKIDMAASSYVPPYQIAGCRVVVHFRWTKGNGGSDFFKATVAKCITI